MWIVVPLSNQPQPISPTRGGHTAARLEDNGPIKLIMSHARVDELNHIWSSLIYCIDVEGRYDGWFTYYYYGDDRSTLQVKISV